MLNGDEHTYSEIVVPMLLERIPDSIRLTITQGKQYLEGQHSSCLCMAKPQQASGGIKIGLEITEQLDKILPLDKEIYAELIADEKSTEEDIMAEIELQD